MGYVNRSWLTEIWSKNSNSKLHGQPLKANKIIIQRWQNMSVIPQQKKKKAKEERI